MLFGYMINWQAGRGIRKQTLNHLTGLSSFRRLGTSPSFDSLSLLLVELPAFCFPSLPLLLIDDESGFNSFSSLSSFKFLRAPVGAESLFASASCLRRSSMM